MFQHEDLLEALGNSYTNQVVRRLQDFAFLPDSQIQALSDLALSEEWGRENFALKKYLAVHIPWSIEQRAYSQSENQFYIRAGHLQTRYGTPIYLVFEKNNLEDKQPYILKHIGSDVSAPELPSSSEIPAPPDIPVGVEIVMLHEHILGENSNRVPFLANTPPVAQMCAVSGAIQWSLNRGLQLSYWYYGVMNYLVPLYLKSREDITLAPDVIAPVQVNKDSLLVRTVLEPHMPYANARVSVKRHDQLPHWMLNAWTDRAQAMTMEQLEAPEG